MPDAMTDAEIEAFLKEPRVAVIATVSEMERPNVAPTWFLWEDGMAYMFTSRRSKKWRNIETNNRRVALCIDEREPPYSAVIVEGVVGVTEKPLYDYVRRMAIAYYGPEKGEEFAERYREPRSDVVLYRLVPAKIIAQRS